MAANSLIPQWLGESIRNFNGRKRRASQNGNGPEPRLFELYAVSGAVSDRPWCPFPDTGEAGPGPVGAKRDRDPGLL